jgi:transcriptional regulator with GAF, ATPase, and Fis domain
MRQTRNPATNPDSVFREVTIRVCGDFEINRALADVLEYLSDHVPAVDISLNVFEKDLGAIRPIAWASLADAAPPEPVRAVPVAISKRARSELSGQELSDVRIVNRPDSDTVTREIAERRRDQREFSLLLMRLVSRGQRLGTLMLRAEGFDRFTPEHADLMRQLNAPFAIALSNALRFQQLESLRDRLADDNRDLRSQLREESLVEVIGADFGLRDLMEMVRQVAPSTSPVLLLGETGTGKEVIANAIHELSARRDGPFVRVNCGAIAESLIDSELFGHEKGAFTSAITQTRGRFERAHQGTILLDEIGDLPQSAQVKLLRVLQNKEFERVGGTQTLPADVRVIAATHRDLQSMARVGTFRQDLWFRLSVFPLRIPPLRERRSDIPALVKYLMERKARELNLSATPLLAPTAIDELLAYDWPGNVRELQNVLERALILSRGRPLSFPGLGAIRAAGTSDCRRSLETASLDDVTSEHLRHALEAAGGKIEGPDGAAELLGLNPSTLRHKLRKYRIQFGRPKNGPTTPPQSAQ